MKPLLRLLPFVFSAPLFAQGLLIGPAPGEAPRPPGALAPRTGGVSITRTAVNAEIVDGIATTTIDQVFRNDGSRDAEGTWFLPLPAGAFADGFTMTVGGKEVQGEVLDANQARGIYEAIVRQRRDPGLLEYAGEGLLRARIYPIPANGEVGVTVRLRQVLAPTGGLYEWAWPLRAAQRGDAAVGPIGLSVRIKSQTAIRSVLTPQANAEIRRLGEHEATVSLEGRIDQLDDLRVVYGLSEQEFGLHLLPYRGGDEAGYFTMLVSPPRSLAGKEPPRRCVQFVLDTSGSMQGVKLVQAKAALRAFVGRLREQDLFQVVTFASGVQTFFASPVLASAENVATALARIDAVQAMGGTNIADALKQALEVPLPANDGPALLPQIVFVTDGMPTVGVTDPGRILELTKQVDKQAMRVFAFGVGDDIDVRLLDDLVIQHHGARDFVRQNEKIEVKVDALCQKLAEPALTDVELRCDTLDAFDVHPGHLPDLFCGEQIQIVGRYRGAGKQTVRVRGKQNGVEREFVFTVEFPAAMEQYAFVKTLWARQHVAAMLDAIRRNGPKQELIDEVRRLATQYGIVTPYTSQLILEEQDRLARRQRGDGAVPPTGGGRGGRAGPSGPTTGGPTGPGGGLRPPSAPTVPAPARLQDLGKTRTGAEAIRESLEIDGREAKDEEAKNAGRARDNALVRRAGGRVFVAVGDDLVEQGLPADWATLAVSIEAFSDAWFELQRKDKKLSEVLALGERVVFRDGARIVRITPAPQAEAEPAKK
ncbi:MAG: VWA domain-containing protein [Planctomycetes bacterium]|nr:VWA domain-containing protein [Planctomycetota bacterium]